MLETYVLTLLAIWLTITIIGQLTGAYLGFDIIQKIKKLQVYMILSILILVGICIVGILAYLGMKGTGAL